VKKAMWAGCNAATVQRVFAANLALFETIEVAGVPFDDHAAARRLCGDLCDGRTGLPVEVPENPEILEEPAVSGYFGLVTRADLPPEFAEALFTDGLGEFVGPVAYDRRHWVFQILMTRRAELNDVVYEYCESLLGESSSVRRPGGYDTVGRTGS
jgi:hypothetical protein